MPHSSGGGSHGGGFHGGSHGSHGGGSGGIRISRRYFPGARRFMYYDRGEMPCYIYSNRMPEKQSRGIFIFLMIFMIPFVAAGIFIAVIGISRMLPQRQRPLKPVYAETSVHITDNIGVIDNDSQLEHSLQAFQKKTGICPYLITVHDEDWNDNYSNLERYAYSLYASHFSDEQHFLVVYSEPENARDLNFVNWTWEGMQGDYTDPILTETKLCKFRANLHKNMTIESNSVGEAFEKAFTDSLDYIMKSTAKKSEGLELLGASAFWNLLVWLTIILTIKGYKHSNREYMEVPLDPANQVNTNQ